MPVLNRVLSRKKCSIFFALIFTTYLLWKPDISSKSDADRSDEMLEITKTWTDEQTIRDDNDYSPIIVDHLNFDDRQFKVL